VDPETGDERVAIFRSRDTTSYLIWTETRWELMGTAPLKGMSYDQAFNTIHDSPIEAMAANDAVAFMQAIPLVRTADSISQGKVLESGLNLASDVTDTLSLGGTAAGSNALKWAGRSILAGQVGLGTYEATQQGDTSRLKGAMVDLAVQSITGVKSTKSSTSGKLSTSGSEVAIGEGAAQGLAPKGPFKGNVPTSELNPTHRINVTRGAAKKEFEKLKADIAKNGIQEPIRYVENGGQKYIVDGHHRLRAARELGLTDVPVQQVELPYGGYKCVDDLLNYYNN
jgi:hypothetical protein